MKKKFLGDCPTCPTCPKTVYRPDLQEGSDDDIYKVGNVEIYETGKTY